jgi:hypothetical protein
MWGWSMWEGVEGGISGCVAKMHRMGRKRQFLLTIINSMIYKR